MPRDAEVARRTKETDVKVSLRLDGAGESRVATTVPFFDQYSLSLSFWSPDSRYLVVTKENDNNTDGTVWIVDTTGQEAPRQVGEGTLAVWSWR